MKLFAIIANSAEKYLKGYLASKGDEISRTHDLPLLNNSCRSYEPSFDSIEDECLNLTDFGVNIRYPYHLDLNETDVDRAFEER